MTPVNANVKKPFSEVYEEYYSRIYKTVYMRLLSREETEDVVQDTFIKAMSAYPQFDPSRASVSTWLTRIALNTLTDHFRVNHKIVMFPIEEAPEQGAEDEELNALTDGFAKEAYVILRGLNDEERELLMMRYGEELSYKEIAERTGSSDRALSKRVERLLEKCRRIAEEAGI